ncbi:hypothetical protein BH11CYA1_BH11CYA1_32230 [soil metagenome]
MFTPTDRLAQVPTPPSKLSYATHKVDCNYSVDGLTIKAG